MANPVPPDAQRSPPPRRDREAGAGRWWVRWWALVPSALAPVLLLVGLAVAPTLQPPGFDSVRDSISELAGQDATDRGLMTTTLAGLGLAYLATALCLTGAGLAGRVLLGMAGISTALIAAFPLPAGGTPSPGHAVFAAIAVLAMSVWPLGLVSWRSGANLPDPPFPARLPVAVTSTLVLVGLVMWFALEQWVRGTYVGLSERVAAMAQATWPLIVVSTALATQRRDADPQPVRETGR